MSGYQELKKANPTFPILVREASGVEAKLVARYGALLAGPLSCILGANGQGRRSAACCGCHASGLAVACAHSE